MAGKDMVARVDFSDFKKVIKKMEKDFADQNEPRDPKRIPKILKRLERIWKQNPDLRLSQLILDAAKDDIYYYLEDSALLGKMERFYKNKNKNRK
jgi:hypothetical protein